MMQEKTNIGILPLLKDSYTTPFGIFKCDVQ